MPISAGESPRREEAGEAGDSGGGTPAVTDRSTRRHGASPLSFCRSRRLPSRRGQSAFAVSLLGMPPRHREMGRPLCGLRHLGHRRRSRGARRGQRLVDAACGRPDLARGADQLDRPRPHPPHPHRNHRTGPGARRRGGPRLGDAAGGRSGSRQVDAAAGGRPPVGGRPASARCICPARNRRARSGCGPSAPAARTTRSTWPPNPTCRWRWATSTRCSPAWLSSTRCRPCPRRRPRASPAASPRCARSPRH